MVKVLGNATTGNIYNDHLVHIDLPRDTTTIRAPHKPWCVDCKRTGRDLDDDQRCAQCTRAAASRAAGAARRAAEEQARIAAAAGAKKGKAPTPPTPPSPPAPLDTRPVAAIDPAENRAKRTQPDVTSPEVENIQPTTAQIIDAQVDHVATLLRATADHPHPAIRAARTAAVASLEALHLLNELTPTATPARARTTPKPRAARPTPTRGPVVDEAAVVREYNDGDTPPTIARRHGTTPNRVRRILDQSSVPRRDDRVAHSGGHNLMTPTQELVDELRRQYVDEQLPILEIAEHHGVHRRVITRFLRDAGIEIRPPAHERGTDLTADQVEALVDGYRNRDSLNDLARRFHIRPQQARQLVVDAGLEVRTKGASTHIGARLAELGVTAKHVKQWAYDHGHTDRIATGLVAGRLIDLYAAAHPTSLTA